VAAQPDERLDETTAVAPASLRKSRRDSAIVASEI
jgi:hypothetical protein